MLYYRILYITVLSDFYEVPLIKQYISHIFFHCIFNKYLINYGELPKIVLDKIYTPIKMKKYCSNNSYNDVISSKKCIQIYSSIYY